MDNARQAAAAGFIRSESIPLLALTDESFYHGKLSWTLRFPVPPPDTSGSARRFSSTVTFQQGPHSAEALDGALCECMVPTGTHCLCELAGVCDML